MEKQIIIGQLAFAATLVSFIIGIIIWMIVKSLKPKTTFLNTGLAKRPTPKSFEDSQQEFLKISRQKYSDDLYNALVDIYEDKEVFSHLWESQQEYIIRTLKNAGYKTK